MLYRLPGVHHREAANVGPGQATEREMAGRGGAKGGAHPHVWAGHACFCAGVRPARAPSCAGARLGGVPFFAQAPSSARVPAFPEARRDTKGCRESAERGRGLWSDFGSQTTWSGFSGAGSGLTGTAGLVPPYVPFPSFPCSNGLAGRIGYTGRRRWSRWEHEHPPSSLLRPNGGADSVSEPAEPRTPEGQPMAPLPSLVLYPSRSPGAWRW